MQVVNRGYQKLRDWFGGIGHADAIDELAFLMRRHLANKRIGTIDLESVDCLCDKTNLRALILLLKVSGLQPSEDLAKIMPVDNTYTIVSSSLEMVYMISVDAFADSVTGGIDLPIVKGRLAREYRLTGIPGQVNSFLAALHRDPLTFYWVPDDEGMFVTTIPADLVRAALLLAHHEEG